MRLELSINDETLEALEHHLAVQARLVAIDMILPNIADKLAANVVGAAKAAGWKPEAEKKRRGKK